MSDLNFQAFMRGVEEQQRARAEQLPTEQDCVSAMLQARLRLLDLGWRSGELAPKDGSTFEAINAGFTGPSVCQWLGSSFFVADGGDWWPVPSPLVFRPLSKGGK